MTTIVLPEIEQLTETGESLDSIIVPYEDDDNPDVRTHIVRPLENAHLDLPDNATGQDIVDQARFFQQEIVALCGHKFIPKRNPEKYDVCQPCMDIATNNLSGLG